MRILIAEDHPSLARSLADGLREDGYAVDLTHDGDEALHLSQVNAYDGILRANKKAFDEHPEYLGLVGGVRKSSKFCISNPELRKLVADYFVRQVAKRPNTDSISVSTPSITIHCPICLCRCCNAWGWRPTSSLPPQGPCAALKWLDDCPDPDFNPYG